MPFHEAQMITGFEDSGTGSRYVRWARLIADLADWNMNKGGEKTGVVDAPEAGFGMMRLVYVSLGERLRRGSFIAMSVSPWSRAAGRVRHSMSRLWCGRLGAI
jgi:hypothetical protein